MDVRALPDLGRPRGLSILAAACLPNISGKTSRAVRAREGRLDPYRILTIRSFGIALALHTA
jgi:hypothetical protein